MSVPPEKKQKTEETPAEEAKPMETEKAEETPAPEAPKVPEPPKELEEDAPACSKAKVKEAATFLTQDTTLNVLHSAGNNVLMTLTEGGAQHFLAGARANVGISKGRYMFETKIMQVVQTGELQANQSALRHPQLVRVGFSTADSELILGEGTDNICFESTGKTIHNRSKNSNGDKFWPENVVAVLLNLDKDSPNFNTVSLFREGKRVSQPIPLPESMKGKTLFPHVTYRHASVHLNFGPAPFKPLPFTCRMVKDATAADVTVVKAQEPSDGKYEVVFPVSLPDEGSFDWLDMFLEKNKSYNELSDRKFLSWAEKSGIWRKAGYALKGCLDKPEMYFGSRELDDGSFRRAMHAVANLQKRNYVVMEVRGNLIKEERQTALSLFTAPHFKRVATVMVGDPIAEFKKRTQQLMLTQKQTASDMAFRLKKLEEQRKKELQKRQKALEKAKRQEERKRKKALEAAKKAVDEKIKAAEEAAKKAAEEKKEGEEEKKDEEEKKEDEEKKEEEKKEEEKKEEEPEEESEEEAEEVEEKPDNEQPPKVELTKEEKAQSFRTLEMKDLTPVLFSASFTKFSIPEKEEGFDDIKYEWAKIPKKAADFLTEWKLNKKLSTRVEDLVPSQWFHSNLKQWQGTYQGYQQKQNEFRNAQAKKAAAKAQRENKKALAAKLKEAKEKAEAERKEKEAAEKKDGEEEKKDEKKDEEKKEEETKAMEVEEEKEEEEEEEVAVDFEGLDIFGADDVNDIGGGMPMCKDFQHEDWTMMALRYDLHLLAHAFCRDVDDAERPGIHVDDIGFYYNKYYRRGLNHKDYGVESFKDLLGMVNDTMFVTEKGVVVGMHADEMENPQVFIKITEAARRHRLLRIDLGEENAVLKLSVPYQGSERKGNQNWSQGGGGGGWKKQGQYQGQQQYQQPQQFQQQGGFQGNQSKGGGGHQPYGKGGSKSGGGWQDRNHGKGGKDYGKGGKDQGKGGKDQGKGGYGKWKGGSSGKY